MQEKRKNNLQNTFRLKSASAFNTFSRESYIL